MSPRVVFLLHPSWYTESESEYTVQLLVPVRYLEFKKKVCKVLVHLQAVGEYPSVQYDVDKITVDEDGFRFSFSFFFYCVGTWPR